MRISLRALGSVLALAALAGCQRKAPGPLECERAAMELAGVFDPRALANPEVKDLVDEITVECLTAPYDRALLDCFEQIGTAKACYREFQLRHGLRTRVGRRRALSAPR